MQSSNLLMENRKSQSCGWKFWSMLAVFYALFVVRNALSISFPVFLYLIWIAVMAITFDDTEIKALIISFIPLVPGFQSKYGILICMLVLIIKYFNRIKIPAFVLIIPALMIWEAFHLGDKYSTFAEYLSGFAPLMCLAVVVSLPSKEEDTSFFARILAVSSVVAFSILLITTIKTSGQSLLSLIQSGFRFGAVENLESGHKLIYNANGLGYLCNIAIAGLLMNTAFNKAKKIDYLMLFFIIFIGCLTVSRTFLLCLFGTIVVYLVVQKRPLFYKIRSFFVIALVILVLCIALKILAPSMIDNYVLRFNADDVTGGRSKLLDFYNRFITSTPQRFWFGIGVQNIDKKIIRLMGVEMNVPHNGYQQTIVAWGVIGLALVLLFLLLLTLHAKQKNPRAPIISYLPLILLLVNIMAGQLVTAGTKLLSLVFIYLMICNGKTGDNYKNNGK